MDLQFYFERGERERERRVYYLREREREGLNCLSRVFLVRNGEEVVGFSKEGYE